MKPNIVTAIDHLTIAARSVELLPTTNAKAFVMEAIEKATVILQNIKDGKPDAYCHGD